MVDTYLNQYEDASISVSTFNIRSMCEKAIRCVIEDGETKKKLKPNWKTKKNRKTRSSQTALCIIDVQSSFCKILRDADQVSASISSRNSLKYLGSKMILSIHPSIVFNIFICLVLIECNCNQKGVELKHYTVILSILEWNICFVCK